MALKESTYPSTDELNRGFANTIASILAKGIAQNGRASLVVSGGRTPQAMFKVLSERDLDWQKVDITLADERWVSTDDDASNEKMVRNHLLVNQAAAANFIGLKNQHANAEQGVAECTENLQQMHTPFDVLILGMGEDGHTASLFPCSEQISAGLNMDSEDSYIAVQPTTAPNQRMSLTLPALLNSKHIFLHLTGEAKRQVLKEATSGQDESAMPIRAVLNRADVELVWAP